MRRPLLLLAWLSCGCGAASAPPAPASRAEIVNGAPDDADPAVVGIALGGALVCTGVLISERLILTAAHCLDGATPPQLAVFFGASPGTSGRFVQVGALQRHPSFGRPDLLSHDLAVLVLAEPAAATPLSLELTQRGPDMIGQPLRLVGFGRSSADDASPPIKRTGRAEITGVDVLTFEVGPQPAQSCFGDSGGPALLKTDAGDVVFGIASAADPACAHGGTDTQVGAYYGDFIAPLLAATAPRRAAAGERCWHADNCQTGRCEQPPGEPTAYCAAWCERDADCPAGTTCAAAGICRYSGRTPPPGAPGAACLQDLDCGSGLCVDDPLAGRVCADRCFPDQPVTGCAEPSRCAQAAGAWVCLPEPGASGGCGAGPGGPVFSAVWLVLTALRRERSRRARPPAHAASGSMPSFLIKRCR